MRKIGIIVGLVLLAVVFSLSSVLVDSRTAIAQTTTSKLCSVVVGGNWRDTFSVPSGWNAGTCLNFKNAVRANDYQLACAFNNSFSWGAVNGGTPNPNCGW
jgi:hypothetical protein